MVEVEIALALKNPTLEAEYQLSDETPLKLYDCLVPKLKEFLRAKPIYTQEHAVQK